MMMMMMMMMTMTNDDDAGGCDGGCGGGGDIEYVRSYVASVVDRLCPDHCVFCCVRSVASTEPI